MFELSQTFSFDAAHTLKRNVSPEEAAGSRRIHGHTYTAEVTVRGERQPESGMVVDLAVLREVLAEIRSQLDHHFLDEVAGWARHAREPERVHPRPRAAPHSAGVERGRLARCGRPLRVPPASLSPP